MGGGGVQRHEGTTTIGPDATHPPAICQNLQSGGGGVGGRVGGGSGSSGGAAPGICAGFLCTWGYRTSSDLRQRRGGPVSAHKQGTRGLSPHRVRRWSLQQKITEAVNHKSSEVEAKGSAFDSFLLSVCGGHPLLHDTARGLPLWSTYQGPRIGGVTNGVLVRVVRCFPSSQPMV